MPVYVKHMIKCPRNYHILPGREPYVMEVDPLLKNVSNDAVKTFGVKRMRPKRDKFGNKIINFNNFYQPPISAAEAIERIWDPLNPICKFQCRGRCMEGKGKIHEKSIRRLG